MAATKRTQQFNSAPVKNNTLASARRVLTTEGHALIGMSDLINESFHQAIELIWKAEGRVIITGMGKSGHVARKIAATMSSTGTPSFFVHPAEASHGDMGMIVAGDVVLALSNSGEAKELTDLIEYTRRFSIPLISITSNAQSTLGSKSDVVLLLPKFAEACPNGLAPTTSTTLTMALGDALAVALLEAKGFTAKDFKVFHPGGKLGQQLMRVTEIMHTDEHMPIAHENIVMKDAIEVINAKSFGCVVLTNDEGILTGLITDGDIRRNLSDGLLAKQAKDIMTKSPKTAPVSMLVAEAMAIMNDPQKKSRQITSMIVVDDAMKPVGLLHIHDCLKAGFA